MKKVNGYWVDENENKWYANSCSKKQAEEFSKTLIDCVGCRDCRNCVGCQDCNGCTGSNYCQHCTSCHGCISCSWCSHCFNCRNCNDCIRCEKCNDCWSSHDCKDSNYLTICMKCINCQRSTGLIRCIGCEGCVKCVDRLEVKGEWNASWLPKTPEPTEETQTAKADDGKLQISLVPTQIIKDIAEVRMYGNKKYGDPNNWKTVELKRYVDAFLRHTLEFVKDNNSTDTESRIAHYKHMACNMAFICEMMNNESNPE